MCTELNSDGNRQKVVLAALVNATASKLSHTVHWNKTGLSSACLHTYIRDGFECPWGNQCAGTSKH